MPHIRVKCPSCGSIEISRPQLSGQALAISLLLLGFPLPFFKRTYHCFNCGLDFKRQKEIKKP
jgi:DNA-directed RNA polymerase subunit RPC12/RpoP